MFGISRTDERLTALLIPTTDGTDSQYPTREETQSVRLSLWERSREMITRAERKAGELLGQLERDKPKPYSRLENGSLSEYTAVLTDSDIAPTTAHRWQSLDPTKVYLCRPIRLIKTQLSD